MGTPRHITLLERAESAMKEYNPTSPTPIPQHDETLINSYVPSTDREIKLAKQYIRKYCKRVPRNHRLTQPELFEALNLMQHPIRLNKRARKGWE